MLIHNEFCTSLTHKCDLYDKYSALLRFTTGKKHSNNTSLKKTDNTLLVGNANLQHTSSIDVLK